jgi:uncharacterized membrane protein YedE/YeeE
MNRNRALPWWLGGALLAGVLLASIVLVGPLGVSTQYVRAVGFACDAVSPGAAEHNPYFAEEKVVFGWPEWVVIGIPIGALVVALVRRRLRTPPPVLDAPLPTLLGRRWITAFVGGGLVLFGARLAGGCTSGHILSGVSQLAVSSTLFMVGVFAAGLLTARLMLPKGGVP